MSSFNPTSLRYLTSFSRSLIIRLLFIIIRLYTPSPHHDGIGDTLPEDDIISEDFSDTDNRDVTEIDEEINLGRIPRPLQKSLYKDLCKG